MDLKILLVSKETISEEVVAKSLHGLISIISETGDVLPLGPINKLDGFKRILAYLLGRRAAVALGVSKNAGAMAEQIASTLGMDLQRVREHLSRAKGKYFDKTAEGYEIPLSRIPSVCEELNAKRG